MNRLLKELHDLMLRKIRLYDQFIELLRKQWTCTTEYSLEPLVVLNEKKERMVEEMQDLEKQRSSVMLSIERKLGAPPGLTLKKLMRMHRDPMNVKLMKSRERMLKQIATINDLHEGIRNLTDYSSLALKKSMAFIHATGEAAVSPYESDGRVGEGKMQSRMLSVDA